jgi:hypothetical protein
MPEAEQLREATREAHEAMKDMKCLMRECRALMDEMRVVAAREVNRTVHAEIQAGLAAHEKAIIEAVQDGTNAVYARFAELGDILLGEDRSSVRAGHSIRRMVQDWVAEDAK